MSDMTDGLRECRCGMKVDAELVAMVAHINSDEHAQRLAQKGLGEVRHSDARFPEPAERN